MKILLIIDIQYEYSKKGNLPVFNYKEVTNSILQHLKNTNYDKVILIKHENESGIFDKNSNLSSLDERFINLSKDIVIKKYADAFDDTNLLNLINKVNKNSHENQIFICGMMTQNCVTYTALTSKQLGYQTTIIENLCSTIDKNVHNIAISALKSKDISII